MPRQPTLSLDLLRTFSRLLQNDGDAAQTATELGINQPSMSKRLANLQHVGPLLDRPWLERHGKTWEATVEGRRVLPAVEEILSRHDQLTKFIHEPIQPSVHFACGQQSAAGFVRSAAKEFRKRVPDTALSISTIRGEQRIEGVANGSLDLATVTHQDADIFRLARRELHIEPICEDRLALVCSEHAPWANTVSKLPKTKAPADALTRCPLILPERDSGLRHWFDGILRQQGILRSVDAVLETGGWQTILAYVKDGFGVGVVPDSVATDLRNVLVRKLDPNVFPPRTTKLICRPRSDSKTGRDLSDEAQTFRSLLIGCVNK